MYYSQFRSSELKSEDVVLPYKLLFQISASCNLKFFKSKLKPEEIWIQIIDYIYCDIQDEKIGRTLLFYTFFI